MKTYKRTERAVPGILHGDLELGVAVQQQFHVDFCSPIVFPFVCDSSVDFVGGFGSVLPFRHSSAPDPNPGFFGKQ